MAKSSRQLRRGNVGLAGYEHSHEIAFEGEGGKLLQVRFDQAKRKAAAMGTDVKLLAYQSGPALILSFKSPAARADFLKSAYGIEGREFPFSQAVHFKDEPLERVKVWADIAKIFAEKADLEYEMDGDADRVTMHFASETDRVTMMTMLESEEFRGVLGHILTKKGMAPDLNWS